MSMRKRNRALFNTFGIVAIACWLVMIGVLVKRVHFNGHPDGMEQTAEAVSIDSSQREWKEIYLKDKKVGYAVELIRPFENGYFIQEEIF